MISFEIPGDAIGKGRPRFTRLGRAYTPAKTREHEGFVKYLATQAQGDTPPYAGPVSLYIHVRVAVPTSWSKKKRAQAFEGLLYPETKPDLDNIVKGLADACNGIAYADDKQIVHIECTKVYAAQAATLVRIRGIDEVFT